MSSSGILLSCTSCIGGTIHLLSCASRVGRTTHYCHVHLRGEIICSVSVHLEGPISYCCVITWVGSFTVVLCTSCRWYRLHLSFVSCIHCWDHLLRSCFSRTGALVCYRLMRLMGHARHVHLSGLLYHCLIHPTKFEAYAIVLCTLYMWNHLLIVLCISGWCLHKQLSFISHAVILSSLHRDPSLSCYLSCTGGTTCYFLVILWWWNYMLLSRGSQEGGVILYRCLPLSCTYHTVRITCYCLEGLM